MEVRPRSRQRGLGLTRLRWPLLLLAIAVVGVPAGYAVAQTTQSSEPSGSPVDWSQEEWVAHDPALDPAAWEDAKFVPMDCPPVSAEGEPTAASVECWRAEGIPKLNHDAPEPWPQRKLWCEDTLSRSESATSPSCDADPIPESYPPEVKAELEAYGADRAFGGAAKR